MSDTTHSGPGRITLRKLAWVSDGYWDRAAVLPQLTCAHARFDASEHAASPDALRTWLSREGADAVWLDVEPDAVPRWVDAAAPSGLPLLLSAPHAAHRGPADALGERLRGAQLPAIVAHRLPLNSALRRAAAAVRRGDVAGATDVRLRVRAPLVMSLESTLRFKKDHDLLMGTVADALDLLDTLGYAPGTWKIEYTPGARYWGQLEATGQAAAGARVTLTVLPTAGLTREESLEITAPGKRLRWIASGDGEQLLFEDGAKKLGRRFAASSWLADAAGALGDVLAGAIPTWRDFERLSGLLDAAESLTDQYVHGHAKALREAEVAAKLLQLRAPNSFWSGFAPTSQAGFDLALLAELPQCEPFQRRVSRPLSVLLVRAPVLSKAGMRELFPPLAIAQLSAAAGAVGCERELIDLAPLVDRGDRPSDVDLRAAAERVAAHLETRLAGRRFDLVGISLDDPGAWPVMEHACHAVLRRTGATIVMGGRGTGRVAHDISDARAVDYVLFGEGELAFARMAQVVAGDAPVDTVPGLWKPGTPMRSRNPPVLPDYRFHPPPDFGGLDLSVYRSGKNLIPAPFLPYLFILGCPYKCAFCANDSAQRSRYRPPAQAVADLHSLRDRHNVRHFYFLNNLLNTTRYVLEEFLGAMESADLGVKWADCARPYNLDRDTLTRMRDVGCVELTYGIDTGSQRLSNLMRKGYKLERAIETLQNAHEVGISSAVNLIVGMPHETEQDFEETCRFVERMRPVVSYWQLSPYVYNPGSPLFENPRAFGLRRRGEHFDEQSGVTFREHLDARDRRYRTLQKLIGTLYNRGMAGFEEYCVDDGDEDGLLNPMAESSC